MNPTMDAIYVLSPQSHVVDCLVADLDRRRYKSAFLVWTAVLDPQVRRRIDASPAARQQIAGFETLSVDFFPREAQVITFRDPWSFPILYHPACNNLVRAHMSILAQKVCLRLAPKGLYRNLADFALRSPISAYRLASIPKSGTTDRRIHLTRQASCVPTWLVSYRRNSINTPSGIKTSRRLRQDLQACSS